MRRRRRGPPTQFARAGERTQLLIGDAHIAQVRFKATVFQGEPTGNLSIETVDGTRTQALSEDNLLDSDGLISLSVVPDRDTAVTFVPVEGTKISPMVVLGMLAMLVAIGWTVWDIIG